MSEGGREEGREGGREGRLRREGRINQVTKMAVEI